MIITRTPLRISLGGGGTDAPSFYEQAPGFVLSAAIDKYIYVAINPRFTPDFLLKYSAMERVDRIDEIEHPIIREALDYLDVAPGIEIVTLADIPAGTGLGSSGSFTVGLLRALHAYKTEHIDPLSLAEQACHIELDRLGEPSGKQDQFIAAYGGLTCFDFNSDGTVVAARAEISVATLHDLEDHLVLFFTGYSRSSSSILEDQHTRSRGGDEAMMANLHETLEIGRQIRKVLEAGEPAEFGRLMDQHWRIKRGRSEGMTNESIDHWYARGMANGALGGKLVGAGAGGFLMFYAVEPDRVRAAMADEGLAEVRFAFDHDGSSVIVRD